MLSGIALSGAPCLSKGWETLPMKDLSQETTDTKESVPIKSLLFGLFPFLLK